jgi:hypothetical protein
MYNTIDDPQVMKVWATVFVGEAIGVRVGDIAMLCNFSRNAAECALKYLVDQGFLQYRLQQVGTGGNQERFYQVCPNSAVLNRKEH